MSKRRRLRTRNNSPAAKRRRLESTDEDMFSEEKEELVFDEESESEAEPVPKRRSRKKRRLRKKNNSPSPEPECARKRFSITEDLVTFFNDNESYDDGSVVDSDNFIVDDTEVPIVQEVVKHDARFISSSESDSDDVNEPEDVLASFLFEMQVLKTVKESKPTVNSIETWDFWGQNKRIYSEFLASVVSEKYFSKSRERELILTFGIIMEMLKEGGMYEKGVTMERINCYNEEYSLLRSISNILHPAAEQITESEIQRYRHSFLSQDAIHLGSARLLADMAENKEFLHEEGCNVPIMRDLYTKSADLFSCKNFRKSPSREQFMEFLKFDPEADYRIKAAARLGKLKIRRKRLSINPRAKIKKYFKLLDDFNKRFPPEEIKGISKDSERIIVGTDNLINLGNRKQYRKARMQRIAEVHKLTPDETIPLLKAMGRVMCDTCLGYPRVFRYRMFVPSVEEDNSQFSNQSMLEEKNDQFDLEEKAEAPKLDRNSWNADGLELEEKEQIEERLVPADAQPEGWGSSTDEEEEAIEDDDSIEENMDSFEVGGRCSQMDYDRKHACKCGERISLAAKITEMIRKIGEFVPGRLLNRIGMRKVSSRLYSDFFRIYIAACIQLSKETLDVGLNSRTSTKKAPTEWEMDHGIL